MLYLLNNYSRVRFLLDQYKYDIRNTFANEDGGDIGITILVWNPITHEYEQETSIPSFGYLFESNYSYCKNASEISFDNGQINVKATGKDSCFAYFKKSNDDVLVKIYTKESADAERVEVFEVPDRSYAYQSYTCNHGTEISFSEAKRELVINAKEKSECEVDFIKRSADVTLHFYKEDALGTHVFDDLKYVEVNEAPGLNYEYYSHKCYNSDVITTIYPENGRLHIESSGQNECNVYYNGGSSKVEIIIMQETTDGVSGYTTGKRYSRSFSIPSAGYKYVGYLCDNDEATVTYHNGTFIGESVVQTTCHVYFEEYNNNVFFNYYLETSNGTYEEVAMPPTLGYAYNSGKSYCEHNSVITMFGNTPLVDATEEDECHIYYYMTTNDIKVNVYVMNKNTGRYELSPAPIYGYTFYTGSCTNGASINYRNGNLKVISDQPTVCTVYFK